MDGSAMNNLQVFKKPKLQILNIHALMVNIRPKACQQCSFPTYMPQDADYFIEVWSHPLFKPKNGNKSKL